MLGDILSAILNMDAGDGPEAPPAVQRAVRAIFGLLGFLGCIVGVVAFALKEDVPNSAMRLGMMGVFLALGWFCLKTVWLRRSPRQAAWLLALSFLLLFGGAVAQ